MPTSSQPLRTFAFLNRVAGAKSSYGGNTATNCLTNPASTAHKADRMTSKAVPQAMRIIDQHIGKLACCACAGCCGQTDCKASLGNLLGPPVSGSR